MTQKVGINAKQPYTLTSVVISSERLDKELEVRSIVSDFEIYEHIDKPYLTGRLLLIDTDNILQTVDFLGAEQITIKIKSPKENSKAFSNTFYISKITNTDKINNNAQSIVFHLIEDIAYISNLQTVNRSYKGKIGTILEKVSFNYLNNKKITSSQTDYSDTKVIVPNLDPLQTMLWLKKKAKTKEGFPFYLYSSLVSKNLQFHDLGTMLEALPINPDDPFVSSPVVAQDPNPSVHNKTIHTHRFSEAADLFTLIQHGLIGGGYEFINTTQPENEKFHYSVIKDLFKPLIDKNVLPKDQNNPPLSPKYKYEGKQFDEHDAVVSSIIGGSNAYRITDENVFLTGYNEELNRSDYKAKVLAAAMDGILRKEPLTMSVNGFDFIDGDKHSTIGNQIIIHFPQSKPDVKNTKPDPRKSGRYLIFAARHMFKKERYDIVLTCVKLGSLNR